MTFSRAWSGGPGRVWNPKRSQEPRHRNSSSAQGALSARIAAQAPGAVLCPPSLGHRTDTPGAAGQHWLSSRPRCWLLPPPHSWIVPLASCHLCHHRLPFQLDEKLVLSHGREELCHSRGFIYTCQPSGSGCSQRQRQTNLPCWKLQMCQDLFILLCKKCKQQEDPAFKRSAGNSGMALLK